MKARRTTRWALVPRSFLGAAAVAVGVIAASALPASAANNGENVAQAPTPKGALRSSSAAGAEAQARSAFDSFTQTWMEKLRGSSALRTVSTSSGSTIKRFSTTHSEEVKPTGSASNPYVGVLHYTEESYNCSDAAQRNCTLVESTPVTEIFRYQNGKWVY
ncbi:MAG TPA: hypothetical protein VKM54_05865 [Myxococcota bacterium]|nr:hypothetical protein [Myxococcota bacterium]